MPSLSVVGFSRIERGTQPIFSSWPGCCAKAERLRMGIESKGLFDRMNKDGLNDEAEGGDSAAGSAFEHLVQEGDGDARSGAADRVPKSDGPTVHVEAIVIHVQLAVTGQHLRGKGLV